MSEEILDFRTFSSTSRPAFEALKSAPGLLAMYLGAQIESPDTQVLVLHWASADAYTAAADNEDEDDAAKYTFSAQVPVKRGSPAAALAAPCTEVMTGYGVEKETFMGQCTEFMAKVDAGVGMTDGYHGYALGGETLSDIQKGREGESGKGVVLLLGWDSKEAHVQAKAKPGRKSFPSLFFWRNSCHQLGGHDANILGQLSAKTSTWFGRLERMSIW